MNQTTGRLGILACVIALCCGVASAQGAATLEQEARALFDAKEFARARARFTEARELHAEAREPVAAARCLLLAGRCFEAERRFPDAATAARRGFAELRRLQGPGAELRDELRETGWRFLRGYRRPEEAEPLLASAVDVARALGERDAGLARSLNCHGLALYLLSRAAEAEPVLLEALDIWNAIHEGDHVDTAHTLSNLGAVLDALGRSGAAVTRLEEALAMRRRLAGGADNFDVANGLNNLAAALEKHGRLQDSLAMHREFLAMARRLTGGDHTFVATGLGNEAVSLRKLGRHTEALPVFEASLGMWQRLAPRGYASAADVANARHNVANCLRHLGRPEDALPMLEKALAEWSGFYPGDHRRIMIGLQAAGECLYSLGRHGESLVRMRNALAMAERLYEGDHPATAKQLLNVGRCLVALGRPREGCAFTARALAMWRRLQGEEHPDIETYVSGHAIALRAAGRPEDAIALAEPGLAMARRLESPFRDRLIVITGACLLDLGQTKRAATLLDEAIRITEARRRAAASLTEFDRAAFFAYLKELDAYALMQRAQIDLGDDHAALRFVEQARARSLLDLLAAGRSDPLREVRARIEAKADGALLGQIDRVIADLDRIDTEVARLTVRVAKEKDRVKRREAVRQLAAAQRARDDVLRRRARLVKTTVPMASPANPADLRELAGRDGHVLIYALGSRSSTLFHVPAGDDPIRAYRLESRVAEIERMVRAAQPQRSGAGRGVLVPADETSAEAQSLRLFRALIPVEVWHRLKKAAVVYIVPHGPLHRLSFEGLRVGDDRTWLDEGAPVVYGASGAALLWSRRRRAEQEPRADLGHVVTVAEPSFGNLPPLPGSLREIAAIRRALPATKVTELVGKQATRPALRKHAKTAHVLHIATHGIGDETASTSSSRLALALPSRPTPEDDGFLDVSDLLTRWRNQLDGCELVVLSACSTQEGVLQKDEAVMALPVGFLYAGAPTVIATIAPVDDEVTADLMARFYARLARGEPKLEAFAAARKAIRKKCPEPRFWAPFIYIGAR